MSAVTHWPTPPGNASFRTTAPYTPPSDRGRTA